MTNTILLYYIITDLSLYMYIYTYICIYLYYNYYLVYHDAFLLFLSILYHTGSLPQSIHCTISDKLIGLFTMIVAKHDLLLINNK